MKHLLAAVLFCTPALLAAHDHCRQTFAPRLGVSWVIGLGPMTAEQTMILFGQQIL